jgi:hypothetical protein
MTDADRRDRYAAAICASEEHDWELIKAQYPDDVTSYRKNADAAMAVADAEQRVRQGEQAEKYMASLREVTELVPEESEMKRLHGVRAAAFREAADMAREWRYSSPQMESLERRLRRMAEEPSR